MKLRYVFQFWHEVFIVHCCSYAMYVVHTVKEILQIFDVLNKMADDIAD